VTATAQPSAPVEAPEGALDRAQGVELLGDVHGSGYKEGAALVRRGDGQMVQLGPLMYALLECVDGQRDAAALTACLSESTGRTFDEEHVHALANKLAAQGLLAGTEDNAPARANPLLALRWKVLITNTRLTKRLTAPFMGLFRPWLLWPILAAFLGVCWFVLIHKGVASATHQAFHKPELLLLVFVLAIASAGFHEIGHASACRYGGATPGGMGMGLYMVWPAFYTDVTDAYRLPRRDRLRTDLGGLYFNTIIAVATVGAWLVWHVDALLLLVAVQLIEMVKQLSPMIRADGYHILADATGVPDLYAHIGPTLKRLLPGHGKEPSALTGRARVIVTLWVLIVVPVLLSLAVGAILLFPRLLATGWESARHIGSAIPGQAEHGHVLGLIISFGRFVGLLLPVVGTFLMSQKLLQSFVAKGRAWSDGRPLRRGALVAVATAAACGVAYAWWPVGQYQPVRANERGTLVSFVTAPTHAVRPATQPAPIQLTPGTHLAISMIPVGGASKKHPALFVIAGTKDQPAVAILSTSTEDAQATDPATTTPAATTTTDTTTTTAAPSSQSTTVQGTAFPFKLPSAPRPGDSQAVAVGTKDGGVVYNVAYSLVTVKDGSAVNNTNSAFAFANCNACKTVAVSFQIVLIIGQSNTIAPVNAAGALNVNCPACMTIAIADQIVVTLSSQPSDELVAKLQAALAKLNALPALGAEGSPAAIAAAVVAVQQEIDSELANSGLLTNPPTSTTTASTTTASTTTTATTTTTTATTTSSDGAAPAGPSTTTTNAATSPPTTTTGATTTTDPTTTTTPATPPSTTTDETTTSTTTTTSTG
jgi:putative peptide zinc metalloprotease protein